MYRHLRILIAEDNQDDAFLLKRAFLKAGINAPMEFVGDGEQALDYLHGRRQFANRATHPEPKLVILDLLMPRVNGFEVLKKVRENPELHRLPVIVLTCLADKTSVNHAHDLGVNGYVTKPEAADGYDSLVNCLEEWWLKRNRLPTPGDMKWHHHL